ncbi:hypothetical protein FNB79_14285 [Formosa sediminum]|uniref:Uncharacterized protein n=1 Tax=Formosa sediminum TaxID=2594004 RepID=A0A516GU89_9FLAO|nr:hypothetical protein [Formosa sediminum]QDO95089.1 hypothetical protein FNB79_14285 [Formosa sediminum]
MKHLKKHFQIYLLLTVTVLFSNCTSNDDDQKEEAETTDEKLAISSFNMLSKDHTFSVLASKVYTVDSLVVCLFPSPVNYSSLTPTIEFEGTSLSYRVNEEEFKPYTASVGEPIDFSYPNTVDFKVSNSDQTNAKVYRIIVDTQQPILFNNSVITIPDSPVNKTYAGLEVDTWTNVGNYPIRLTLRTNNYINITTPEAAGANIFSTTLSIPEAANLNPKQQGYVNVYAGASVTGTYTATALFNMYFQENLRYIVYEDVSTSEYIKDIGYKPAQLNMSGTIID